MSLIVACKNGNLAKVKSILKNEPEKVNRKWAEGSLLHYASGNGHLEIARFLLSMAPQLANVTDTLSGETTLHYACVRGQLEIVQLLLDKAPQLVDSTANLDVTPLHYAARCGHFEIVKILIKKSPQLVEVQDSAGENAIHYAAQQGHLDVVKFLAGRSPPLVNIPSLCTGETLLHKASIGGHLGVVRFLLEKSPKLNTTRCHDGSTALLSGCSKLGTVDTVQFLLDKAPHLIEITDKKGSTALHHACQSGNLGIVKFLLNVEPQLWKRFSNSGSTALHEACLYGNLEVVKSLLEKVPELAKVHDKQSSTALQKAYEGCYPEIAKILCENETKLSLCSIQDRYGKQPIEVNGNVRVADFLKQAGDIGNAQKPTKRKAPEANCRGVKLFFSYFSSVRKDAIIKLADHLQGKTGCKIAIDRKTLAEDTFHTKIKGIIDAHAVLCFFSEAYQESPNCMREMEFALKKGKEIIPILVERSFQPSERFLSILGSNQPTDYFEEFHFQSAVSSITNALQVYST